MGKLTPEDFIGSCEVNLNDLLPSSTTSSSNHGDVVDLWVDLEHVKTGSMHLQFRRSIITSPLLNNVLTDLLRLVSYVFFALIYYSNFFVGFYSRNALGRNLIL